MSDIEKVRRHLKIEKWVVFGGSWGSTLSLTYAETHPSSVVALVLRGIFTLRRKELVWFYQEGASFVFPDYWEEYLAPIPEPERFDMMSAYHRRLTGSDPAARDACAAVGAGVVRLSFSVLRHQPPPIPSPFPLSAPFFEGLEQVGVCHSEALCRS